MAQGWARSPEKILAELVRLFQVVKSRDEGGLPQMLGVWCRDTQGRKGGGDILISPMENRTVVQGLAASGSSLETGELDAWLPPRISHRPALPLSLPLLSCCFRQAFCSASLWPLCCHSLYCSLCPVTTLPLLILCVLYLEVLKNKDVV